jgi:hypothetical protein
MRSEQILARRVMALRPDVEFKQNAKDWWRGKGIWVMPNRVEGRVRVSVPIAFDSLSAETLTMLRSGVGDVRAEETAKRHLSFLVIDGTDMEIVRAALSLV